MKHSDICGQCDGSGFITWYDEGSDCQDEDNCPCADADFADELCHECLKANP